MSASQISSDLAPLALSATAPFGVGGRRRCFVDPRDPSRCVKVLRTDEKRVVRLNKSAWYPAWLRRTYDNNADELKELGALQRKLGPELMARHFPRVYGMTPTDMGAGLVLDLIRDADGKISRSLRELLANGADLQALRPAYDAFGCFLLEHGIVTRDLLDHNLSVRHEADGTFTFFLIDGFGDSVWLPFGRWIPAFARRRIQGKISKGWARFEELAAALADPARAATAIRWKIGFLKHR